MQRIHRPGTILFISIQNLFPHVSLCELKYQKENWISDTLEIYKELAVVYTRNDSVHIISAANIQYISLETLFGNRHLKSSESVIYSLIQIYVRRFEERFDTVLVFCDIANGKGIACTARFRDYFSNYFPVLFRSLTDDAFADEIVGRPQVVSHRSIFL
jgi:hypothetical protein